MLFGLFSLGATRHADSVDFQRGLASGAITLDASQAVRATRVYLTDELDEQRYLAYVDALLGRPYQPYFVRSLASWQAEIFQYEVEPETDAPKVTPPHALVPYRDFAVEYPPGFFLWALPPGFVSDDIDGYRVAFTTWMALLATLAMVVAIRIASRPAFAVSPARLIAYAAGSAAGLGVVMTHRFDSAVALLLITAAWAALERRPVILGIAMGLAAVTKGIPLLAAPAIVLWLYQQRRFSEIVTATISATISGLAVAAPFLVIAPAALRSAATYHLARPLQVESTIAAFLMMLTRGGLTVVHSYGSINLGNLGGDLATSALRMATPIALVTLLGTFALTARKILRASDDNREHALLIGMVAPLVAFMVSAKVFSPQYIVWLLPIAILLSLSRGNRNTLLWVAVCVLSQVIYPITYHQLARLAPWAAAIVVVRNVSLLWWAIQQLRTIRQ